MSNQPIYRTYEFKNDEPAPPDNPEMLKPDVRSMQELQADAMEFQAGRAHILELDLTEEERAHNAMLRNWDATKMRLVAAEARNQQLYGDLATARADHARTIRLHKVERILWNIVVPICSIIAGAVGWFVAKSIH